MTKTFVGAWKQFPKHKPPEHNPWKGKSFERKFYLVTHKGGWVELAEWSCDNFFRWEGKRDYLIRDQVIAWMELPPPFTAEKEKEE